MSYEYMIPLKPLFLWTGIIRTVCDIHACSVFYIFVHLASNSESPSICIRLRRMYIAGINPRRLIVSKSTINGAVIATHSKGLFSVTTMRWKKLYMKKYPKKLTNEAVGNRNLIITMR